MKVFTILILIIISGLINLNINKPKVSINKQESAVNLNNDFVSIFDFGQRRFISSILWVTTLLESDLEHYGGQDLQSWLYLRFKTIANIDPLFLENYQFGGLYLSIVKDDLIGAEDIFLKGLKHYPNDYKLNYNLGFLYAIESDDYKKSIPYLEKVVDDPRAPKFLSSLIIKIKHEVDKNYEVSFKMLKDLYEKTENEYIKKKIYKDLYQLRAILDLKCLNENKNNCNRVDLDGNTYMTNNKGKYYSQQPINMKFGIKKK